MGKIDLHDESFNPFGPPDGWGHGAKPTGWEPHDYENSQYEPIAQFWLEHSNNEEFLAIVDLFAESDRFSRYSQPMIDALLKTRKGQALYKLINTYAKVTETEPIFNSDTPPNSQQLQFIRDAFVKVMTPS